MSQGRVVQNCSPSELLRHPADPFVTSFIGEDRGLRTLQYTTLAELAGPAPTNVPVDGLVLPGTLSVLDAGRELGLHGNPTADGLWVSDDAGRPSGYLTFQQFTTVLGETLAAEPTTPPDGEFHGLPA